MTHRLAIRPATPADAAALGTVAPAIYADAYAHMWDDPAAYARHLATFGAAAFAAVLARADARLWLAEAAGLPVGFLQLLLDTPDPVRGLAGGAAVARLYLMRQVQRQGLGPRLLAAAEACARGSGARYLWLDAMERAPEALAAYRRWGFAGIGRTAFAGGMAEGWAPMIVLARPLR